MKKKIGSTTLPEGRVSHESQRVRGVDATFSVFRKQKIRHFEKYLHTMMLKLTEHVGITIFLLYKQKTRWNSDIQNFYSEILNFRLFYAKNRNLAQFSGPAFLYDVITT